MALKYVISEVLVSLTENFDVRNVNQNNVFLVSKSNEDNFITELTIKKLDALEHTYRIIIKNIETNQEKRLLIFHNTYDDSLSVAGL